MRNKIILLLCLSLSGCTLVSAIHPKKAPDGSNFYLSEVAPVLVRYDSYLGIARYLRWEGLETFESFIICPGGLPEKNDTSRCVQFYGGVKIDGSDALWRQGNGDNRWGYVYTPSEQATFRLKTVDSSISVYNMGGQ